MSEYCYYYSKGKMKLSCMLLLYLTNIMLIAIVPCVPHIPYLHANIDVLSPLFLATVLLAFLQASFLKRRSLTRVTAAAARTTTTAGTTTTLQLPAATSTTTAPQTVSTLSSTETRTTTTAGTTTTLQLPAATSTTTVPPSRCKNGYTFYSGPGNSFCFRLSDICATWDMARSVCQMEGGDLVVLDGDSLIPFTNSLRQFLLKINCDIPFVYFGAMIDDTGTARYITGGTIPKDSPIWFQGLGFEPNKCVAAGNDDDNVVLLYGPCNLRQGYACQHF
ncbi:hypothetical protein CHS0354_025677 [Potamilus streckersoni]|uniref:C-type lectin domain-containing protein n=1 Tax=Potamilus streckersoni TaxID=2493646 RepID=A0AAE0S131_9BIVA|nr:hypothetical protein CHS0354_025677 [Potamilus streckersoni]